MLQTRTRAHPALGVIVVEGLQIRDVARECHYHPQYVARVLRKQMRLSPEFRRRLSAVLGRPESELFDEDLEVAS